jgi:Ca-activated chloride channel family protein
VSGRHRTFGRSGQGNRRAPLAVVAIIALLAVGAVTVRIVAANASGCTGSIKLRVVATPEIAPVLDDIGAAWTAGSPQVGGKCISLKVDGVPAPTIASSLTVYAGRAIDVAAAPEPTPTDDMIPTVWVPDSTAWLTRVEVVDHAAFADNPRSIASSPVVLAMPEIAAKQVGWPAAPLKIAQIKALLASGNPAIKLGVAEPRRETASLAATMMLGDALASSDDDLPALVKTFRGLVKTTGTGELLRTFGTRVTVGPASEQAVLAYNETNPPLKLVAVQVDPSAPVLDYPYAIRASASRDLAQAAELFRTTLLTESAASRLARKGFRTADGTASPGFPSTTATTSAQYSGVPVDDTARVQRALALWTAANSASRTLAMFDLTSSMATPMATANGVATRADVMAAAAKGGLGLFTPESKVGMWAFANTTIQVLPIDELTPENRANFDQRMAGARPIGTNRAELYQALLAAYKVMKDGYDAARPNIIVVLTDGGDSDLSPLRKEQFKQDLQRLADPTKPIRIVLIGINVSQTDAANLQAIAEIVGGGFFPLTSPEQIQTIFLKALLRVGAA